MQNKKNIDNYISVIRLNSEASFAEIIKKRHISSKEAERMIDLLPDSIWTPYTTFLEAGATSGILSEVIKKRLKEKADYSNIDNIDDWIDTKQLFILTYSSRASNFIRGNLYGRGYIKGNVIQYSNLEADYSDSSDLVRKWKGFINMKIDVVVGNPPYTHKKHIPFMTAGHLLASKYDIWIVPDDWIGLESPKPNIKRWLDDFNNNVKPNIREIISFDSISKVFPLVTITSGCTILFNDKEVHDDIIINGEIQPKDRLDIGLNITELERNIINKVASKLENKFIPDKITRGYYVTFKYSQDKPFCDTTNEDFVYLYDAKGECPLSSKYCNHLGTAKSDYKLVLSVRALSNKNYTPIILAPNHVPTHSYTVIFTGTEEEVNSINSYLGTKLIRWLVWRFYLGTSINASVFKYVPMPTDFMHTFTDIELYKKYDLTEDEIDCIENYFR